MNYSKKMKTIMEYDGWKQKEVAQALNISTSAFNQFINQKKIIPLKQLNSFCNLFNISIDYFFDFTSKEQYENSKKNISYDIFIERFNYTRREKNLSQKNIEIKTGIPRTTVENYETNKSKITTKALYTICSKYNISADYLLGKINSPKYLNSTKK